MNIVVAMKQVPDLVEDLVVDDEGTALDRDEVDYKLNEFDDHALEEALLLKESAGGSVTVMIVDGENVDKILFTALAKGADKAIKLTDVEDEDIKGTLSLAGLMAQGLKDQTYDLIFTGVQASDDRDGQLAPTLAALLNIANVNVVASVQGTDSGVVVHKEFSGGLMAEYDVSFPAVLGIQAAQKAPRYVPVSKVNQVKKEATIESIEVDIDKEPLSKVLSMAAPETGKGATMLGGVADLVKVLEEAGVLS